LVSLYSNNLSHSDAKHFQNQWKNSALRQHKTDACAREIVQHHQSNNATSGLMVLKFDTVNWYGEAALLHQMG
jgi:hypothetical protein